MLEDHWDDGMYQDVAECSALCDSFPNCNFFLHGLDSRTNLNRCRVQPKCERRRSYGFGGGVHLYARAVAVAEGCQIGIELLQNPGFEEPGSGTAPSGAAGWDYT